MIVLTAMNDAGFAAFTRRSVSEYASEKMRAGEYAEADAEARAQQEFGRLLSAGAATPGHHFFTVSEAASSAVVGELWGQERQRGGRPTLHVLDIHIDPAQRRRGYARAALVALEAYAAGLGSAEISLHVFGHNLVAQKLYASLGFHITDISMAKSLPPQRERRDAN